MDAAERSHIEQLIQVNQAVLRDLELKAASFGDLYVPSHVTLQIEQQRAKIAELEQRLRAELPYHNLPQRDYEQFVGRAKELAELRRLLQPYPKSRAYVITIDGIGGIGKSALALEAAYALRDQFANLPEAERFDAIVWVSAKRSYLTADGILERSQAFRTLNDLYAAIAQVLDYPAITRAKAEDQRAIVEEVLRNQRTLLILDNLETVDDEDLLIFLRELPDPTKAIVTTRHRIDVAHPIRLTGMPHEDTMRLIGQEAARKNVTLSADEQEQLWQRTGGMPLAIVWSIGLMGLGGSADTVIRRLGGGQSDIARFCFEESVARIRDRDAHKSLMALSLFASDASRESLGVVAGFGDDEFGRDIALEELLRLSLVNKIHDRYGLLPLTQGFVHLEVEQHDEWMRQARQRWVAYYFDFVNQFSGWSQDWRGHDLVEKDLANIFAVFNYLVTSLRYEATSEREQVIAPGSLPQARMALKIADRVARTCRIRGYWSDCETLAMAALPISKLANPGLLGWLSYTLARVNLYRGNADATRRWSQASLDVVKRTGDTGLSSRAHILLGLVELQNANFEVADGLIEFGLQEALQSGKAGATSNALAGKGDVALGRRDLPMATSYYQQAAELAKQRNDIPKLSSHLLSLGKVAFLERDLERAELHFKESLNLATECGWVSIRAFALLSQASLGLRRNQHSAAARSANDALDLFRRLGMKREQAEAEALLAKIAQASDSAAQ